MNQCPAIFGLLLTFRRQSLLVSVLETMRTQTRPLDQLLVVDNENSAETQRTVARAQSTFTRTELRFAATPTNLGAAGGWAYGMRHVLERARDDDWIMPLDDDDPPSEPTDFARMIDFALASRQQHDKLAAVGIVGARFDTWSGRITRVPDAELRGGVRVDLVGSGHLAMYRVSALRAVGTFDERLFFGHEELELGLRLRRAGYLTLANGDLWNERRRQAGRWGIRYRPSPICGLGWKRYYSIRNYAYVLKQWGRWDLVLKHVLVQCVAKPAWTALAKPRNAIPGFRLAVRACADGIGGRMGRQVEPGTE